MGVLQVSILIFWWDANVLVGSYLAWFVIALFVARSIGIFVIPVFVIFILSFIIGFGYQVMSVFDNSEHKSYLKAVIEAVRGRDLSETQDEVINEETEKLKKPTDIPG